MNLDLESLLRTSLTWFTVGEELQRLLLMRHKGPNADDIVKTMIPNPCTDTLDWFFELEEFQKWKLSATSCSIWIQGSPGQGKSVLAKRIVNELKVESQGQPSCHVIYFFCYHRHDQFRSADAILRGFIVQLLEDQQTIPDELEVYLDDLVMFSSESSARLFDLFQILVKNSHRSTYYFVIDALDECQAGNDRAELLSQLQNLCTENNGSKLIKFLFTSRPGPQGVDFEESLRGSIHMYLQADMNDIAKVIHNNIKGLQSGRNKKFILDENDVIIEALSRKAGRTYIWIRSIVKELRTMSPPTLAAFQALVDSLPTELDLLYRKLVERFLEDDFTTRLLLLVAYAKRPLQIEELIEAIAIGSCSNYSKLDDLKPHRAHLDKEELRDRAGALLQVTSEGSVSLIHQSVADFLVKENPFRSLGMYQDPEFYVAQIFCSYLCSQDFESPIPPADEKRNSDDSYWIGEFPFGTYKLLRYASHNWYRHIKNIETGVRLKEYIVKLVSPQLTTSLWWRLARNMGQDWREKSISTKHQIAIKYDIDWLACLLLSGYCQNLSEPFPVEEIAYTAETNLSMFSYLMELHEYHQLAFDKHNIPLAIAIAGDSALHHMKRYCNSHNGYSPFPNEFLQALARSRQGLHETFEYLITRKIVTCITENIIKDATSNPLMTEETMDMLLSRSVNVTADLIYTVARNSWELAWHLIMKNQVEVDVSKLLGVLVVDNPRNHHGATGLLHHLSHFRNINITEDLVRHLSHQNEDVSIPFMDALVRQTDYIYVEPDAAKLIFGRFHIRFTRILLQRDDIKISCLASIFTAGVDSPYKTSILDLIFEHLDNVVLTEDVIGDAVGQSMLHSVVGRYARDTLGLCKFFLPQIGAEYPEILQEKPRISKAARQCDGAVTKYILRHSDDTFITDGMLEASARLPNDEVIRAIHNHRAKQNIYNLPIPLKLFITVLKNTSPGALGILQYLIDLDGGASITDEMLDALTEAVVVMTTTTTPLAPGREMLGVLLRIKSCRRAWVGIPEKLYKAAVENLHHHVAASMLGGLLRNSSPDWQPNYALLEAAARNSFDTCQLLQEHKRAKILREDIPEKLSAMKQSMSPEILLAAVGNSRPESETPGLVRYILKQPGCLEITPDVWRTARANPKYGKELDTILTEFILGKSQDKIQDFSQETDVNMLDGSGELSAEFLLQDLADSDADSWDEESDPGDGEEMNYDIEDVPSDEQT